MSESLEGGRAMIANPAQPSPSHDLSTFEVATSRYFSKELVEMSGLTPLGFTVGPPKWLSLDLAGNLRFLSPVESFKIDDREEFIPIYVQRLERFGIDAIEAVLQSIAVAHGTTGVCLLCFCDLHKEGAWCHRRVFAEWWEEKTGEAVRELA